MAVVNYSVLENVNTSTLLPVVLCIAKLLSQEILISLENLNIVPSGMIQISADEFLSKCHAAQRIIE